ncbi:hypothetical protein AVEN_243956-2-1, partial [Araneus ventricosus]
SLNIKPKAGETELKLEQIIDEFDKFFGDYKNEIFASFVLLEIKQKPYEKFQEFYTRLKLVAEDCNYDKPERMLRDKIVQGISDKPLQERLLWETEEKDHQENRKHFKKSYLSANLPNSAKISQKR